MQKKPLKKILIPVSVIVCLIPATLFGNPVEKYFKFQPTGTDCDSSGFIDSNTSVTFYGDSRGDFVDMQPVFWRDPPFIEDAGMIGWPVYLSTGSGAVPGNPAVWNVQNQVVGGIPIEILQMNIEMLARGRQAINDELTKRGVTEL